MKTRDRIIRMDRIHEFWIDREINGNYSVLAGVFGSQPILLETFPTYSEAEEFLDRLSYAIASKKIVDIDSLKDMDDFSENEDDDFPL
ncbi:MAG: hypothetical protein ABIL16_04865 [candidate division WOR-3 bacterium]